MSNMMAEGMDGLLVSFRTDGTLAAGQVVKVAGNGTAAACRVGDLFCGVVGRCGNGTVGVQVHGIAEVSATLPLTLGPTRLVADGKGGVMNGEKGVAVQVMNVDAETATAMICL